MTIINYLELIRPRYHITFATVACSALFFASEITISLVFSLVLLYFAFNFLMYGGLYTMNEIADVKYDKKHPVKSKRPLPSGKISVRNAVLFSAIMVVFGLSFSYFYFGKTISYFFLGFIFLNIIYTFIAKKVPYIELIFNALTHPLRAAMGVAFVGAALPYSLISVVFLLAFGISTMRRRFERDNDGWEAREVIKHYSKMELNVLVLLSFLFIVVFFVIDYPKYLLIYLLVFLAYISSTIGALYLKPLNKYFRHMWLK